MSICTSSQGFGYSRDRRVVRVTDITFAHDQVRDTWKGVAGQAGIADFEKYWRAKLRGWSGPFWEKSPTPIPPKVRRRVATDAQTHVRNGRV